MTLKLKMINTRREAGATYEAGKAYALAVEEGHALIRQGDAVELAAESTMEISEPHSPPPPKVHKSKASRGGARPDDYSSWKASKETPPEPAAKDGAAKDEESAE